MPFYDFKCPDCGKKVTLFYPTFAAYEDSKEHKCPKCGGIKLQRRIGRVAIARSEDSRLDTLTDEEMLSRIDENDPRSVGRFMRQMSREMGEEMGDEFDEMVDRLEKGQKPEEIEESMPNLAADAGLSPEVDDDF